MGGWWAPKLSRITPSIVDKFKPCNAALSGLKQANLKRAASNSATAAVLRPVGEEATDRMSGGGNPRLPMAVAPGGACARRPSENPANLPNVRLQRLTTPQQQCLRAPLLGGNMSLALVFPGQGSQVVGMGKALADAFAVARAVFTEVDDALGEKLTSVIWNGPADRLTLTENAQPALMAVSLAVIRVLNVEIGLDVRRDAAFVAGHSLGEYSALAAAGALSLSDAARLLRIRGHAMQQAAPVGAGAMAALIGVELETAAMIAAEAAQGQVCQTANDNGGGQVVISGHKAAVERAVALATAKGVKRAMMLPVSAPFHCALMQPAADVMAAALSRVTIARPVVPLVSNVLAQPITNPSDIMDRLVDQITGMVRWRQSVAFMEAAGVRTFYEIGAGKVLLGLIKRIAEPERCLAVGAPQDIETLKMDRDRTGPNP
jgi:[acyl-carrier-protein] S-malonyltransferase